MERRVDGLAEAIWGRRARLVGSHGLITGFRARGRRLPGAFLAVFYSEKGNFLTEIRPRRARLVLVEGDRGDEVGQRCISMCAARRSSRR